MSDETSGDGRAHLRYIGSLNPASMTSLAGVETKQCDVFTSPEIPIDLLAQQPEERCVHYIHGMNDPA